MMTKAEWRRTPYAGTQAAWTREKIERTLERYGIKWHQITRCRGPHGRSAVVLRFKDKEKMYRIAVETVNAEVDEQLLVRQAERAIFFLLKSTLEFANIFCPLEKAFFAFLELPDGRTVFDMAEPNLDRLTAGVGANFDLLALPAPKKRGAVKK